jgi:hypothetical protein
VERGGILMMRKMAKKKKNTQQQNRFRSTEEGLSNSHSLSIVIQTGVGENSKVK